MPLCATCRSEAETAADYLAPQLEKEETCDRCDTFRGLYQFLKQ